jgi:hypothetical protein
MTSLGVLHSNLDEEEEPGINRFRVLHPHLQEEEPGMRQVGVLRSHFGKLGTRFPGFLC